MPFNVPENVVVLVGKGFIAYSEDLTKVIFFVQSLSEQTGGVSNDFFEVFLFGELICELTQFGDYVDACFFVSKVIFEIF